MDRCYTVPIALCEWTHTGMHTYAARAITSHRRETQRGRKADSNPLSRLIVLSCQTTIVWLGWVTPAKHAIGTQ